jgi:DNA-binding transcriptional regulator YbjK
MKLPAPTRRTIILDAAIRVANRDGLLRVNWNAVASECEMETSDRTVRAYFPRYTALWDAVAADSRFVGDKMGYQAL